MGSVELDTAWELAATERCITRDLGLPSDTVALSPEGHASEHPLLAAFVEKRSSSPEGQETVENLQARIVAYSLHAGRWRGLTWHEREEGLVWLLAGRYHRSGEADDSYPHFRNLTRDALLPSEADYERVFDRQSTEFAQSALDEVGALREAAANDPGMIISGQLGGRIGVRVAYVGESLEVGVNMQLYPGDQQIPSEWLNVVLAAFFPSTAFEDLAYMREIAGAPALQGEIVIGVSSEQG